MSSVRQTCSGSMTLRVIGGMDKPLLSKQEAEWGVTNNFMPIYLKIWVKWTQF